MAVFVVSIPIVLVVLVVFVGVVFALFVLIRKRTNQHGSGIVETGLKAVDLFVPIPLGGDVLLSGEPHAGVRVLGTELAFRLANSPRQPFRVIMFLDSELDDLENVCKELRETLPMVKQIFIAPVVTAEDIRQQRVQASVFKQDALFAISKNARFLHEFRQAVKSDRQSSQSAASLTTFTVTESLSPEGFEAKLISSSLLAKEAVYPALDLRHSFSSASSLPGVKARRQRVANSVRTAVVEVLENLHPGALNDESWSFNADPAKRAAVQAIRFMSQPYFTAEPYTGLKSANVPVADTIKNFEAILSGRFLDRPPRSFQFQNALPPKTS